MKFAEIVLGNILGYSMIESDFEKDSIEFQYRGPNDKGVCFEVKGTDTKDLFAPQHRYKKEHETPIKQIWDYMGKIGLEYGICTNYRQFILIMKKFGYLKYHSFDFESIRSDRTKLQEFVGIFSKTRLVDNDAVRLILKESEIEERDFTGRFYELFHTTRLYLIRTFDDILKDRKRSIHYTQIFLNRLVFIFFVEDRGFIQRITSKNILSKVDGEIMTDDSRLVYDSVNRLFGHFKVGLENSPIKITAFNGGLFSEDIPDSVYFDDLQKPEFFKDIKHDIDYTLSDSTKNILKRYHDLNPIIKNIVKMSSYDFSTEVSVNILGHIFEQSITDLERLQKYDSAIYAQRKKEGIYYTPEHITDYICRQTIIRYLSKSGAATNPDDLIHEYAKDDDMPVLEERLGAIKILDPACGSGAFLVKAVDVLVDIHGTINDYKLNRPSSGQQNLDRPIAEATALEIIKNNIYGVDINEQSAEITKLSLFLTLNSAKTTLPDLSDNIKVGNSLIRDEFDWKKNFQEIFGDGGFDVIVGNPPYVRQEELRSLKESMQLKPGELGIEKFQIPSKTDLSGYFYYHALTWLKNCGYLGFITSDSWLHFDFGEALQNVMLDKCSIKALMRTAFNIFEDADVKTVTTILQKTTDNGGYTKFIYIEDEDDVYGSIDGITRKQNELKSGNWTTYFLRKQFISKIQMAKMRDLGKVRYGRKTGANDFFVLTNDIIKEHNIAKKFLRPVISNDIKGYYLVENDASQYLLYVHESKGRLQKSDEGRRVLKYIERGEMIVNPKRGSNKEPHKISELASVKSNRPWWYSLNLGESPPIFLGIFAYRRMRFFENNGGFYATNNFAYFAPNDMDLAHAFLAYLASTYFALYLEIYGHRAGAGALQFLTTDYKNALVPDFRIMPNGDICRLKDAWAQFKQDLDIKKLDDVVFDVLGFDTDEKGDIITMFEKKNKERLQRD